MARGGKKTLLETTELPIVETELEEGDIPFFLIDDEYGVSADERCYMLCRKKKANRTIKNEDGQPDHVETYYAWTSFKYAGSFKYIIECYTEIKERQLHSREVKNKDYKKFLENQEEIKNIIENAFSAKGNNKDFISFSDLVDQKTKLLKEIEEVKNIKENVIKECNNLLELVKEKRKIIIGETEPKKHRTKKGKE